MLTGGETAIGSDLCFAIYEVHHSRSKRMLTGTPHVSGLVLERSVEEPLLAAIIDGYLRATLLQ